MQGNVEVVTGERAILEAIAKFQAATRKIWCACVESALPAFSLGMVKDGYLAAAKRGVRIMYITEITKDNLSDCKKIMEFAEVRHLHSVRGNFALSETEYIAGVLVGTALVSLVRTDVEEIVRQQHNVFETLWNHSVPAESRFREISG